jgi:hypothetical protein
LAVESRNNERACVVVRLAVQQTKEDEWGDSNLSLSAQAKKGPRIVRETKRDPGISISYLIPLRALAPFITTLSSFALPFFSLI